MKSIPSYTKIITLGSRYTENALVGEVILQEKVDGSQFRFGVNEDGELIFGSKSVILNPDAPEKMFEKGVNYLLSIKDLILESIPRDTYLYAELLEKPKHNVLKYEKVPTNHLVLFDVVMQGAFLERNGLEKITKNLNIDLIPELYRGIVPTYRDKDGSLGHIDFLKRIINTTQSYLGNELIEGVVIKNYKQTILLGGNIFPLFTKYVREQFKERHDAEWAIKNPKNNLLDYVEGFKSEARWQKAIQYLRDKGELEQSPRDIGKLIERVQQDIVEEEKENIKDFLYTKFMVYLNIIKKN
jgi:hypothetical protein